MKRVWLLVGKDFQKKWKNPTVIIGFMLIPLMFAFLFGLVFGGSGENTLPRIRVLVVDHDDSLVSRFFQTALSQGQLKEMIELHFMDREEDAVRRMEQGKASALLVINEGFGTEVLKGNPVELRLVKNPSEQFLPQIVEEIVDTAGLLLSSLFSIFGEEIGVIRGLVDQGDVPDRSVSDLSIRIKNRMEGISKLVFPPVVQLKQEVVRKETETSQGGISLQGYILPAISIMFLLFIINIVFEDLLRERESGTLLRMMASPMSLREFIWSKMAAAAVFGVLCTLFLIGSGALLFQIDWGPPGTVLLIVLALNILISGFISVFYTFIRTERQAGSIMSSVIIVMSLLGGSMVPVSSFPAPVRVLSRFTINYWGVEAFLQAQMRSAVVEILPILAGMTAAGLILSLISAHILKRNLIRGLVK